MEYILVMYIAAAASFGIPSNVNTSLTFDSTAQCNAAATAFEASSPQAEGTCSLVGGGKVGLSMYVYGTDRAAGGIGLQTFASSSACTTGKSNFEASDGSASFARAACLVVPIGGRNDSL